MMVNLFTTLGAAWIQLLKEITTEGRIVSPRGRDTKELIGVSLKVRHSRKNLIVHPVRKLSAKFAVAEWLWISAGRNDVQTMRHYSSRIAEFSDNGDTFAGAYGPRIGFQIPWIMSQLQADPDTRQAVAVVWTPNPASSRDIPCTLTWQLLRRGPLLHAIVTMRSSDAWLGLPYDFFNFSMLTAELAGGLGLDLGSVTFNLGSSHLYRENWDAAREVIDQADQLELIEAPALPGRAPAALILDLAEVERVTRIPGDMLPEEPWLTYVSALSCGSEGAARNVLRTLTEPGIITTKAEDL